MKSRKKECFSLYIPLADIICELTFNNHASFSYFKKRFYSLLTSQKSLIKIVIEENEQEFSFQASPEPMNWTIKKLHTNSLEDIYFIITAIMQYQALTFDIFLLHASSCIINKKAYLFMAPSGSGKSTIIKRFMDEEILSDDIAVLQKKGTRFYVFTSPLDNKTFEITTLKKSFLYKIYFLKQASFTQCISRNTTEALSEILHNNLLFWLLEIKKSQKKGLQTRNTNKTKELYNLGLDILRSSQKQTLYFTKDFNIKSLL